jgi:Ca2+-binding EF-hand superfamily protein
MSKRLFDANGDGEIQPEEESQGEVMVTWMSDYNHVGESYLYDLDRDGSVSYAERMEVMSSMASGMQQVQDLVVEYGDTDGDGKVSQDEGRAIGERIMNSLKETVKAIHSDYDIDGNGVLDEYESRDMMMGVRYEVVDNYTYYDADGNGLLDADERVTFMRGMLMDLLERPQDPPR